MNSNDVEGSGTENPPAMFRRADLAIHQPRKTLLHPAYMLLIMS